MSCGLRISYKCDLFQLSKLVAIFNTLRNFAPDFILNQAYSHYFIVQFGLSPLNILQSCLGRSSKSVFENLLFRKNTLLIINEGYLIQTDPLFYHTKLLKLCNTYVYLLALYGYKINKKIV